MHGRLIHGTEKPVLSFVERSLLRSTDIQYPATCRGAIDAETLTQNLALNSKPTVRGSLMKPVRLLKSMPPTMRAWLVMLRPNTATP